MSELDNTASGSNSYTMPMLTFYPGTRDWQQFEAVLNKDELKDKIRLYDADKRPTSFSFRVNFSIQPGHIWLDELEVIPLEKLD